LCDRKVSDGVISAIEANMRLKEKVSLYSNSHSTIILEGGSVSLINEMFSDSHWENDIEWVVQKLPLPTRANFVQRARKRVHEMLHPTDDNPSILDELVELWADPRTHSILKDIDGYRQLIRFAYSSNIPVEDLCTVEPSTMGLLAARIVEEYWQHAEWQEQQFLPVPASWAIVANIQ